MKKKTIHLVLLAIVLLVLIWSAIDPAYYPTWVLEISPGVVVLLFFSVLYNKFRLTTLSYSIIAFVTILMFIGGHYTFSDVPLFNWLKDTFELKRNHYDRFGHLMKGLSAIVVREIFIRKISLPRGPWLTGIVLSVVLSIAALYEVIEWLVSIIAEGGKASKDFMGTQGDVWDTQWDMTLALIGSIFTLLLLTKLHDFLLKREIGLHNSKR